MKIVRYRKCFTFFFNVKRVGEIENKSAWTCSVSWSTGRAPMSAMEQSLPGTDERGQLRGEGVDHTWKRGFSICGFLEHFDFETCK